MELKEYIKFKEEFFNKKNDEYNKTLECYKNKDFTNLQSDEFMKFEYKYFSSILGINTDELIEIANEIKEFENRNNWNYYFNLDITTDSTYIGDGDIVTDDIYHNASWKEPVDELLKDKKIRILFKRTIGKMLNSIEGTFSPSVDCSVLEMFENEEITWKGMKKITYPKCEF